MKRAIEKGNIEGARIYAQNAIRKKTETLNYLKVRQRWLSLRACPQGSELACPLAARLSPRRSRQPAGDAGEDEPD